MSRSEEEDVQLRRTVNRGRVERGTSKKSRSAWIGNISEGNSSNWRKRGGTEEQGKVGGSEGGRRTKHKK